MLLLIKLKNIHYDTSCLNIMICLTLFILLVASLQGSPFCCDSLPILPPYFPLPFSFAFIYFLFCFFIHFLYICVSKGTYFYPSSINHPLWILCMLQLLNPPSVWPPTFLPSTSYLAPSILLWPTVTTCNNNGACQEWQQKCETLINVIRGMLRGRMVLYLRKRIQGSQLWWEWWKGTIDKEKRCMSPWNCKSSIKFYPPRPPPHFSNEHEH